MDKNLHSMVRREVKSRHTVWAAKGAELLFRCGVKPNTISIAGAVFALIGGAAAVGSFYLPWAGKCWLLLITLLMIQLRLLCNLFDGMVAVEWNCKSASGELFNDFPDRLSDSFLLIGCGFACGTQWGWILGFAAAVTAMLTAYVRVLAGAAGAEQRFLGPMAKQHRMAVLTITALAGAAEGFFTGHQYYALGCGLGIILIGSIITVFRRLRAAYCDLEQK